MINENTTRREFLRCAAGSAAAAALPLGCLLARESPPAKRPNIVLILVDDLGYGDLSSYGAKDLKTPNIDALVAAGMRFDNFYANSPVCSPTRAALLTGRYPPLVGVPGVVRTGRGANFGHLASEAVLLPKLLTAGGYHTAIVGKWHLGLAEPNRPNDRGFEHFHGFLGDMMNDYYTHRRDGRNFMRLNDKTIDPKGHATDLFSRWAVEHLRGRAKSRQPFFLYLAYNAPHTPIQPPADWLEKVKKRRPSIAGKRARLVALIEHMDDGIGQVVRALKDSGLSENTLIVLASDNGGQIGVGANNGPLRAGKGTVYEGGIKVPMCAVFPGRIKSGSRSDRMALTMDLFPTLLEAAGVKIPHAIEGRSFLPALLGRDQPVEDRFVFFSRREGGRYRGKTIEAVRRGDWKLLRNTPAGPLELYNLKDDPKEQHNLNVPGQRPKVFDALADALANYVRRGEAVPWQRPE